LRLKFGILSKYKYYKKIPFLVIFIFYQIFFVFLAKSINSSFLNFFSFLILVFNLNYKLIIEYNYIKTDSLLPIGINIKKALILNYLTELIIYIFLLLPILILNIDYKIIILYFFISLTMVFIKDLIQKNVLYKRILDTFLFITSFVCILFFLPWMNNDVNKIELLYLKPNSEIILISFLSIIFLINCLLYWSWKRKNIPLHQNIEKHFTY